MFSIFCNPLYFFTVPMDGNLKSTKKEKKKFLKIKNV